MGMKTKLVELITRENPVMFEIGAADGKDTDFLLNTITNVGLKLYCFEPDPRNIETFRNYIKDKRAELFEMAIGNLNGKETFYQSSTIYSSSLKRPTEHLFKSWPFIEFNNEFEVDVMTLDKFTCDHKIDIIDFIWADIQGAEDFMLEGGIDTFRNKVKYLYTEYSDIQYYHCEFTLKNILDTLGNNWEIVEDCKTDVLVRNEKLI